MEEANKYAIICASRVTSIGLSLMTHLINLYANFIVSIHQWKPITPSAAFNFPIYSLEKDPNYPQTGGAESIISSTLLPWCTLIKDNFG